MQTDDEFVTISPLHVDGSRYCTKARQCHEVIYFNGNTVKVYRLASDISNLAYPVRFRWFRAMPMAASIELSDGRTVGIVRQGRATDRTGFSKRLWRLRQWPLPGVVLLLTPDEVRMRHSRRLLAHTSVAALFVLEIEAAAATPDDPVWRLASVNATVGLRAAIDRLERRGALPAERPLSRGASLPPDIDEHAPGGDAPDYLLPALLRPAEKRVLDLLSDWPWLGLQDLAALLGVSRPRASQLTAALEGFGLVIRTPASGRRLALTDLGLAMMARRDRTAVGGARKRWSAAPIDAGDWRNVSGRRSRQLLRDMGHTAAVHGFIAALAVQARDLGWDNAQLAPPIRASRSTSGTSAAGARCTPTPSGCCDATTPHGPSSWSGSAGPCAPLQWRRAWPPTCATTPPTGPPTTTGHPPPS